MVHQKLGFIKSLAAAAALSTNSRQRSIPFLAVALTAAFCIAGDRSSDRHRAGAGERHRLSRSHLAPARRIGAGDISRCATPAEGFQFSVGDVAHISLRRGANCPMLPI
jgi:hypothetical protein